MPNTPPASPSTSTSLPFTSQRPAKPIAYVQPARRVGTHAAPTPPLEVRNAEPAFSVQSQQGAFDVAGSSNVAAVAPFHTPPVRNAHNPSYDALNLVSNGTDYRQVAAQFGYASTSAAYRELRDRMRDEAALAVKERGIDCMTAARVFHVADSAEDVTRLMKHVAMYVDPDDYPGADLEAVAMAVGIPRDHPAYPALRWNMLSKPAATTPHVVPAPKATGAGRQHSDRGPSSINQIGLPDAWSRPSVSSAPRSQPELSFNKGSPHDRLEVSRENARLLPDQLMNVFGCSIPRRSMPNLATLLKMARENAAQTNLDTLNGESRSSASTLVEAIPPTEVVVEARDSPHPPARQGALDAVRTQGITCKEAALRFGIPLGSKAYEIFTIVAAKEIGKPLVESGMNVLVVKNALGFATDSHAYLVLRNTRERSPTPTNT